MKVKDPNFTCGECKKSWTLWGAVDIEELNKDYPHCPWCGKVLNIIQEETNP